MYGNADGSISQPPNVFSARDAAGSDSFIGDEHRPTAPQIKPQDIFSSGWLFILQTWTWKHPIGESSLPLPQQNLDQPFPRRKRINYSSAGPNTVNARSRIYKEQAVDLSSEDIVTLQLSDLKLSSWRRIHSGEQVSVFWGRFKNEKAVFISVDVCKAPDKLRKMVREVWVMARLKSLQGDIIPRLYASGFLDGGIWLTIMQDIGRTSIDKNYEELYKDSQQSLP
ncbi:hypothetical protein SELMODRAFT_422677 [Selaginella moellendorffii]|uniref:Protein kinase domain-containing protein n=1 Tax=Selaginella moellendorffii TaxID=88036 RepID=D8SJ68_SELML|nr:hypothetical protein SELMODRAFT_422677 [Selaginella moellendorffii]